MADTLQFMCEEWNWKVCRPPGHARSAGKTLPERIGNDLLLQGKLEEHLLDFQLYDACVQIARDQNKNRSTPALDAIPANTFVYEMYLLYEHMAKNISSSSGSRSSSSSSNRRALSSAYFSEVDAAAAARAFDVHGSVAYEKNRVLAAMYDDDSVTL